MRYLSLLFLLPLLACNGPKSIPVEDGETVFLGTYTRSEGHVDGQASGIYRAAFNQQTGALGEYQTVATPINPSFLTLTRDERQLFAVSEMARPAEPTGYVYAYRVGPDGALRETSRLATDGKAPCHVSLDQTESYAVVSNYVGGVAKMYRVTDEGLADSDVFRVPESLKNGKSSWLHSGVFSPDNKILAVADKGLDRVWLFDVQLTPGKFSPWGKGFVRTPAGAGPRHSVWSANGKNLYVINELGNSMSVFAVDGGALTLTEIQTISTLPKGYAGENSCADVRLHPNGRFLFGSNRGHDSIVTYTVDPATGKLRLIGHTPTGGNTPRNFNLSPNGQFLLAANQDSGNVSVFRIDPNSGTLTAVNDYQIPTPVCIEF